MQTYVQSAMLVSLLRTMLQDYHVVTDITPAAYLSGLIVVTDARAADNWCLRAATLGAVIVHSVSSFVDFFGLHK